MQTPGKGGAVFFPKEVRTVILFANIAISKLVVVTIQLELGYYFVSLVSSYPHMLCPSPSSLSMASIFVPFQETRDLSDAFDSGVDGLTADTSSPSQVSGLLWFPGASRAQSSGAILQTTSDAIRQNIYENFMRELETGTGQGGGGAGERRDPSTGTEEGESSSESAEGSLEQLDLLFEKEQGVVRRAGWLSFKPLVTLHKDRKLELVTRRKWKQYWVTLKGELQSGRRRNNYTP